MQIDPKSAASIGALGVSLHLAGRLPEAAAEYRRYLEVARARRRCALESGHGAAHDPATGRGRNRVSAGRGAGCQQRRAVQEAGRLPARAGQARPPRRTPIVRPSRSIRPCPNRISIWAPYCFRRETLPAAGPSSTWRLARVSREHPQPVWDGGQPGGQADHRPCRSAAADWATPLQFVRYEPLIRQRGGEVVLEVQPPLIPILKQSGFEQVVPIGEAITPPCDFQATLLGLPRIFGTDLASIPATSPLPVGRSPVDRRLGCSPGRAPGFQSRHPLARQRGGRSSSIGSFRWPSSSLWRESRASHWSACKKTAGASKSPSSAVASRSSISATNWTAPTARSWIPPRS